MRIGIDVRKYDDFGIGTYIQNLLREFAAQSTHTFVLLASEAHADLLRSPGNFEVLVEPSSKYSLAELFSMSSRVNKLGLDLFHSPHYTLPFGLAMKSVVTIHDLIHIRMKYSLAQRAYARTMIQHACSSASAVLVDAEFTKNDILETFRVEPDKVIPVHLGVHPSFFEKVDNNEGFRKRHGIQGTYILYVGGLKPHKNVDVLLRAFRKFRTGREVSLLFAGESFDAAPGLRDRIAELGVADLVREAGKLGQEDLVTAYQGALAVVLPSLYEGFGLSMLEAMASGVPAVGARATTIPEVVGDAGLLFDPQDDAALADVLDRLYTDSALRDEYIRRGNKRAREFTWAACAKKTIGIYESVTS